MTRRHRRVWPGTALVAGGLLFCCVAPFVGFDPLLNRLAGVSRPIIPEYPNAWYAQRRVERDREATHRITTFQTTDAREVVLDFYGRGLGPPNGKWHQTSMAHYPPDPSITRTWEYSDYCPDTLVDLRFVAATSDATMVEVDVTQKSCRDQFLRIIGINLGFR